MTSNKDLKSENKTYKLQNNELLQKNDSLLLIEKDNALKVDLLAQKIDSLISSDSIQKNKLKTITWKYAKLKTDYDNATDVVKDSIFTALVNN